MYSCFPESLRWAKQEGERSEEIPLFFGRNTHVTEISIAGKLMVGAVYGCDPNFTKLRI